ncbi:TPA: hypothetical protein N0F65_002087 [Lagenidium giganteum]|uniref:Thiamine phosphate synthase/TenI domain-containing protein n=1 Tax=Lagenidium giganteum TaxID=4803 RepID=A0AAV2ZKG9_9STRA|nr:TPA: hypothetical protein N0F65_002087 [Lagenidium giganteum]
MRPTDLKRLQSPQLLRAERAILALLVKPSDVLHQLEVLSRVVNSDAIDVVQLRVQAPVMSDATNFHRAAHTLRRVINRHDTRAKFVVNDDVEVAMSSGADGVHLKERALGDANVDATIAALRQRHMLVGCSVHSVDAAVRAFLLGVDYIQVGTMFSTPSHPEKTPDMLEGPQLLTAIQHELLGCARTNDNLPQLVAIGGINTTNLAQAIDAGADGVAVIRSIIAATDPVEAALSHRRALDQAKETHATQDTSKL